MIIFRRVIQGILILLALSVLLFFVLSLRPIPASISYGVSFSKFHSDELNLPWKDVYLAILDDLKVRKLRLSAHWPMLEPAKGQYSFSELDFQMNEAQKRNASVILAVGRRLPGWPECHEPDWAKNLSWDDKKTEILSYLETVVNHYRGYNNIEYWQVENEPFLTEFAKENCGDLDTSFLKEEIALVKKLDPSRPVLVTDSGNLGFWYQAWQAGDVFGTSVYRYLWNPQFGEVRSIFPPSFYRAKTSLAELLFGQKKNILIELSLEPWLLKPIVDTPIAVQMNAMSIDRMNETISFGAKTGFDTQYLWGAEWWYYMKTQNHGEFWDRARQLFRNNT